MAVKKLKPRKSRPGAITEELLAKALKATNGRLYHAGQMLNISGSAVLQRIDKSPYLQQVREEALQTRLDAYEKALDELAEEKNLGAICFGLKTLGKSRGYTEHVPIYVPPEIAKSLEQTMRMIGQAQEALKIEESNVIKS